MPDEYDGLKERFLGLLAIAIFALMGQARAEEPYTMCNRPLSHVE
jgi:hypothetical protein